MRMKMAWIGLSLSVWKAFIVKRENRIFYKRNVQRNKMEVIMLLTSQMDFVVLQPLSCVRLCNPMDCSKPDFPVLHHLLELAQTHVIESMPSSHLILCHPLLLLPSIFPSIGVFSNESVLRNRWPKNWSFSISPSNEYWGLISVRMDWLDLLAVQGTLKSLLQHHSSKASILRCSAFMFQLLHS